VQAPPVPQGSLPLPQALTHELPFDTYPGLHAHWWPVAGAALSVHVAATSPLATQGFGAHSFLSVQAEVPVPV
jgi:hypothetical protein